MRFLGVYDTVAAVGNPFNGENGLDLTVNTEKVAQTSHAVMVNENRFAFDLIGLDDLENPRFSNIKQRIFLGAHSDGGGGYGRHIKKWHFQMNEWRLGHDVSIPYPEIVYEPRWRRDQGKPDHMANLTLLWMYNEGTQAGAPFKPLTGLEGLVPDIANMTVDEIEREFVHDSTAAWMYSIERWSNRTDRTVYYPFRSGDDGKGTFSYLELRRLYEEENKELIIEEISSAPGVKAK